MSNLLDLLVAGLATGAIYAIVAVGFTLLWQTSQTINFAQGEFVMLPAFLMLAAMQAGAPFWLAILIGILLSMLLLGLGFKLLLVDPMLRHQRQRMLPAVSRAQRVGLSACDAESGYRDVRSPSRPTRW